MAASPSRAAESASSARPAEARMNDVVRERLYPQLDYFFEKIRADKAAATMDGVAVFNGRDKFLPGKIAVGLSHLLLATPRDDARFARYLQGYREIADLTVGMDNETWGGYYYLLALYRLKSNGLLDEAVSAPTLAKPKAPPQGRRFVTLPDYKLINLPTNYYGVAFSVARLPLLLRLEDGHGSQPPDG